MTKAAPWAVACIGLGSNLGNPAAQIAVAMNQLAGSIGVRVRAVSSLYRSAPEGGLAQPDYFNAAALLDVQRQPLDLLDLLLDIERGLGRDRDGRRNQSRPIDLDLLWHGDGPLDHPRLSLPHPRWHLRNFVLCPLAEIAPDLCINGLPRCANLAAALPLPALQATQAWVWTSPTSGDFR